MTDIYLYVGLSLCLLIGDVTGTCQDIDADGCQKLIAGNPALCDEEVFSYTACAKTCGKCPLTCFHCDNPVTDFQHCNSTLACNPGEKCMLAEVSSSGDGHHEYRMRCASVEMCDGVGIFNVLGRRDVSTHCCTDDLCNSPGYTATTVAPPTTTKLTASCIRDIIFMVEDSSDRSGEQELKLFLSNIINALPIGPDMSRVAIALFNIDVTSKIEMDKNQNASTLVDSILNMHFSHSSNAVDSQKVLSKLTSYANSHRHGDRANVSDVVVILSDHGQSVWIFSHGHTTHLDPNSIHNAQAFAINVGEHSTVRNVLAELATDNNHVFNLPDYQHLDTVESRLLQMMCS